MKTPKTKQYTSSKFLLQENMYKPDYHTFSEIGVGGGGRKQVRYKLHVIKQNNTSQFNVPLKYDRKPT